MAISNLKTDMTNLLNKIDHNHLRKRSGLENFHEFEITADDTAKACQKGAIGVFKKIGMTQQEIEKVSQGGMANSIHSWQQAINGLYNSLAGGAIVSRGGMSNIAVTALYGQQTKNLRGVYLARRSNSRRLVFRTFQSKERGGEATASTVIKQVRNRLWDDWRSRLPSSGTLAGANKPLKETGGAHAFGIATPFAHESGSAIGTDVLKEFSDQINHRDTMIEMQLLGVPTVYSDIVQMIKNAYEIDWEETQKFDPNTGEVQLNRTVRGTVGALNWAGSEKGDVSSIKAVAEEFLNKYLNDNTSKFGFDKSQGMNYNTSKPIKEKAVDAAMVNIVKTFKKKNKDAVVKLKTKAPKNQTRKAKLVKSKKVNSIAGSISIKAAGGSARKKDRKKSKGGELDKLRVLINKRLPAEVRRNMGRPALRNQTGRFSNSVTLESLRPTAAGISGVYNYRTSPYETFENTGKRVWPAAFNPKPLIAKSVRNLALAYTDQKLVSLRRA